MYELGGAKQAGSTYAHGGPAGKRGKSLREGGKNPRLPLGSQPMRRRVSFSNTPTLAVVVGTYLNPVNLPLK